MIEQSAQLVKEAAGRERGIWKETSGLLKVPKYPTSKGPFLIYPKRHSTAEILT